MLFYLASFTVLLGPLVFVHEFGHFFFAKLFRVRVDVFSMGFGPKFLKKKWGETEYCFSLIPLGGYVKLYGQDPYETVTAELKHRALCNLAPWKRFLVFVAGPLANFLFAIFVFGLIMAMGERHLAPVVGRVIEGSPAYIAGFRSGDIVTAVNREVITKYEDLAKVISDSPSQELVFRVRRPAAGQKWSDTTRSSATAPLKEIRVRAQPTSGLSIYGEPIEVGEIDGLSPYRRHPVIGVSNPRSLAAKAGLRTGVEVARFGDARIESWEELQELARVALSRGDTSFRLSVIFHEPSYWSGKEATSAGAAGEIKAIELPAKPLDQLGVYSSELFVLSLVSDSPAAIAGLLPGDRLIAVDGRPLRSFAGLREEVHKTGEQKGAFEIQFERDGKVEVKEITPTLQTVPDGAAREKKQFLMGVYPMLIQSEGETILERTLNPLTITREAWSRAIDLSVKTLVSIKKLFFRQVSVGTLGGPILIGKLAGDSMNRGLAAFLKVMALISISLAIFNVLPIPILDGGHIFLLFVEVLRGRPISMRQTEVVQQVGLSLIVLLLVVVLFNDFSKVGIPALRQLFQ